MQEPSAITTFTEGTVVQLDGHKVMFSNIMRQSYTDAQGQTQEGLAASLSLPTQKEWITAGEGHTFELDGVQYTVLEITNGTVKVGRSEGTATAKPETTVFKGNTVGYLGDRRIAFANVMPRTYQDGDGQTREGLAASVSLPDYEEKQIVGEGSTFVMDGVHYEVVRVSAPSDDEPYAIVEVRTLP